MRVMNRNLKKDSTKKTNSQQIKDINRLFTNLIKVITIREEYLMYKYPSIKDIMMPFMKDKSENIKAYTYDWLHRFEYALDKLSERRTRLHYTAELKDNMFSLYKYEEELNDVSIVYCFNLREL